MASYTSAHQIYAAATSTGGDNVANIIVPIAGRIVGIRGAYISAAAGAVARLEVSLQSTNQFTQNDARNVLFSAVADFGGNFGDYSAFPQVLMDVPVTEMDRIYMHVLQTSAAWRAVFTVLLRHG